MEFIRIQAKGALNSFRQPDFHTYHKTFPLPLKTTVGGMLGGALGIAPETINDEWLLTDRFFMGIVGYYNGRANDLWQIRKYEGKQIKAYSDGKAETPYKTAVIVRELIYAMDFVLYLSFKSMDDLNLVFEKIRNPVWALSLGREDELIRIEAVNKVSLDIETGLYYKNTILPVDLSLSKYEVMIDRNVNLFSKNLLEEAPQIVKVPIAFSYNKETKERNAIAYKTFSFVGNMPIKLENEGYIDKELGYTFQIF